ncbi:tetratricopeptide repeat protein [Dokdonia ponticola]|uniref:Tetratricopeptide repeat protein n=1 Tax=Dokdonia ponticola TaxID=2041041 RepID=A0ABV9HTK3_9FLAO
MKRVIFLGLFLLFSTAIFSQNTRIDSLEIKLNTHTTNDSVRVNLLNEIAESYFTNQDSTKMVLYLNEAKHIAAEINYKKGIGKSLYLMGMSQAFHSNFTLGLENYNKAIEVYKAINFKKGIAECHNSIGRFFYKNGNQKQAIENYKKSLNIYEQLNDIDEVFVVLNNIGWSYLLTGDYDQAIIFYKKALNSSEETSNQSLLSYCLSDLGVIYTHQSNYPLALEYFKKSLIIGKKSGDSISIGNTLGNMGPVYDHLENYEKAIECYKESNRFLNGTDKNGMASNLNNIGLVYKAMKDYEYANQYLKDALEKFKEINNRGSQALSLNNIGDVHVALKKYSIAYQYYEEAKEINIEVDNQLGLCNSYLGIATVYTKQKKYKNALNFALKSQEISNQLELIDYQRDASKLLAEIYKNTNQYKKAFESHKIFKFLNDSLFNKKNIEKIAQLEAEYKYKQALDSASIRELKLTKTVNDTSQNLKKSQRNYLVSIIIFLLISMLLGGIIFYLKFRNIKATTHNIIVEQRLLRSQMTPHFIFNSLSVLQGMILNKEEKKSVVYLSKFSKLLRIILENSREKMVLLSQELAAIENYLSLQNLENESYNYTVSIDETIDTNAFEIPPMLIQPFVENAIEHAFTNQLENREIHVRITYEDQKLICTITDNGVGIHSQPIAKRKDKNSLATTITSERLQILSKDFNREGSVTIENRQKYNEQGTLVTLVIPYKKM